LETHLIQRIGHDAKEPMVLLPKYFVPICEATNFDVKKATARLLKKLPRSFNKSFKKLIVSCKKKNIIKLLGRRVSSVESN
jgi:hypothetical protein